MITNFKFFEQNQEDLYDVADRYDLTYILEYGINKTDEQGNSFLMWTDDFNQIKFLVEHGIDVNITNDYGNNVLFTLSDYDSNFQWQKDKIFYLLEKGVKCVKNNTNELWYEQYSNIYEEDFEEMKKFPEFKKCLKIKKANDFNL